MLTRLRRSALALPAAACVLVLVTVLAVTAIGRADDRSARDDDGGEPAITRLAADFAHADLWARIDRDDDDVITVRGRKCPKSHPDKVGSSLSRSIVIEDGDTERRVIRRSVCAR